LRTIIRTIAALLAFTTTPALADGVTVFAAASLKTALEEVAAQYRADSGQQVTLSFAGSSALARQIEQGAPADIFISANSAWMDRLENAGLLAADTRRDLLGNRLVLVAHGAADDSTQPVTAAQLSADHLAMALVDAVPAGIYGKSALQKLNLWDGVAPRVVQTDNVRAALALVALGEAAQGVVYTTDARAEPRVHIIATFPAETHAPITYPVAGIKGRMTGDAQAFLSYLHGDKAMEIFTNQGFVPLGR